MNPFLMFLLAICSPFLMAITLLAPPYVGIVAASYIIYDKSEKVHPLAGKLHDVFYMVDVYTKLFSGWSEHISEVSFLNYTLPLLILPIFGTMIAIYLTGKLASKIRDTFQIGITY